MVPSSTSLCAEARERFSAVCLPSLRVYHVEKIGYRRCKHCRHHIHHLLVAQQLRATTLCNKGRLTDGFMSSPLGTPRSLGGSNARDTSRPSTPRAYDQFTYAVTRQRQAKETATLSSSSSNTARRAADDPRGTVVRPLRPSRFGFAIAEDGVMHSRIVSPSRHCYAPRVVVMKRWEAEAMGAEETVMDDPFERLRLAVGATSDVEVAALPLSAIRDWCKKLGLGPLETARVELRWKAIPMPSAAVVGLAGDGGGFPRTNGNDNKRRVTPGHGHTVPLPLSPKSPSSTSRGGSSGDARPATPRKSIFHESLRWNASARVDARRSASGSDVKATHPSS
jgi:hypothetical protein